MTYTTADDRMMRVRHNAGTRKASQVNALLVCAVAVQLQTHANPDK